MIEATKGQEWNAEIRKQANMNIREAKEEIKKAVTVYLEKDEFGEYVIPVSRQRPIFMVGAPGIGKTAIMEQIASELDLALVSYSMTHHTRQSALGLPLIESRIYGGREVTVSEYTMSEIIAAIYQVMEASGKTEGILFLDEINCVSETLAPAMLLFLQFKVFGNRPIPPGWVVVTAGNPPEYNKSVKEFDVATMDRLRRIDITEDFGAWKQYAYHRGIHPAVLSFLESNSQCFYSIQASVDGTKYVTARGWEDLSTVMQIYEHKGFAVDSRLIGQYLADEEIARNFHVYYQLYRKYQSDYQMEDILSGVVTEEQVQRAKEARVDERFSIVGVFLGRLNDGFRASMSLNRSLRIVEKSLRSVKKKLQSIHENPDSRKTVQSAPEMPDNKELADALEAEVKTMRRQFKERAAANNVTAEQNKEMLLAEQMLKEYADAAAEKIGNRGGFAEIWKLFTQRNRLYRKDAQEWCARLEHAFAFIEQVWGNGQEMVLFVTELTAGEDSLEFIGKWGSEAYFRCNKQLLVYDVKEELRAEIEKLMI